MENFQLFFTDPDFFLELGFVRLVGTVLEKLADFIQGESYILQPADGHKSLHLLQPIVAVASPLVHFAGYQDFHLFVVPQGLHGHLHHLRELPYL